MASLLPNQIDDIVKSTLADLGKFEWTDISLELQEYVAFNIFMQKERVVLQSGESVDLNVKVTQGDQARWTGLYEEDDISVNNLLEKGNVPWQFIDTHFAYDVREPAFNRGASAILDLIQVRRMDAMNAKAVKLEDAFWGTPDTTNNKKVYGLGYWLVKNATTGFNGGNPSGFTSCGGIDASAHPNWRNWTFQYAAVSQTDLLRKVREACTKTNFRAPTPHRRPEKEEVRFAHYMNYDVLGLVEEYLDTNNENIGFDFGKYDGKAVFRNAPLIWVPHLDTDTADPWIGLDWSTFQLVVLSGYWMKESDPRDVATSSHNTRAIYYDSVCQLRCVNRRRNFIGYK